MNIDISELTQRIEHHKTPYISGVFSLEPKKDGTIKMWISNVQYLYLDPRGEDSKVLPELEFIEAMRKRGGS